MDGWLITHEDCLDGATAALVGLASGLDIRFAQPDSAAVELERIEDHRPVYLADISIPKSEWPRWSPRISQILDHHQTALALAGNAGVTVDLSRSGSHLFYDFALSKRWIADSPAWERLIDSVERYDLWLPQHEAGQSLGRLFRHFGWEWYRTRFAQGWVPYTPEEAAVLAELIAREHDEIQEDLARHVEITSRRYKIAGVWREHEGPTNEVASRLLDQGCDLVLFHKDDGRLSARSSPAIDAARLMEDLFAGGGHARAAGGRVPEEISRDVNGLKELLSRVAAYLDRQANG